MDTSTNKAVKINRWLPYWAVFQADMRQTLQSWLYRFWVFVSLAAAIGYLLYRLGLWRESGISQPSVSFISDLLRWTVVGSVTLIIALTAGTISAERGIMADSVLSRGISRYQYFMGKLHSRLAIVLGTFVFIGIVGILGGFFLQHEDLSLVGSFAALVTLTAMMAAVVSCGVTVSALSNNTMFGVAILWMLLYGTGFALYLLPASFPSPDRALQNLPHILRGHFDWSVLGRLIGYSALISAVAGLVGMICFSRRDV
jgi:hypothetical protein